MVTEQLPDDPGSFAVFFMPNFMGILLAFLLEKFHVESKILSVLPTDAHKYCLLGLGIFAIANANSYLAGSVVMARIEYNVKLPNLYASKTHNSKNATSFNIVQRAHQNFLEQYSQIVLGVLFTALAADRPNIAGVMLITISICRLSYAWGYSKDIKSRMGGVLLSMFISSIGIGYGALVALTLVGLKIIKN